MRALGLVLLVIALEGTAAELEGVKLDERIRAGAQELRLNGIGLRSRAFFKVYVAGLYLPEKAASMQAVLAAPGAKRMALVMLRDVGADSFTASLTDGLRDNLSESELAKHQPQIDALMATMQRMGEAKKGAAIVLDYAPEAGTTVQVNGAAQGPPIAGEEFFRALLRIWVGERPVSADLKRALLGEK